MPTTVRGLAGGGGGGAASRSLWSTTHVVTNAEMLALGLTPLQIVAAPGTGYATKMISGALMSYPSAGGPFTAYGNVDPTATFAFNTGGGNDISSYSQPGDTSNILNGSSALLGFDPNQDAQVTNYHLLENEPIYLKLYNGGANLNGGGSGNAFPCLVTYFVIDINTGLLVPAP